MNLSLLPKSYNTINLAARFKSLPAEDQKNPELIKAMRHYDYTVNITWVMAHYRTANKYLNSGQNQAAATGGSALGEVHASKIPKTPVFFQNCGVIRNDKIGAMRFKKTQKLFLGLLWGLIGLMVSCGEDKDSAQQCS